MKVPQLPEKPVDGFTIEHWSFEPCGSWRPGLRRYLAIYIENMTWAEFVKDPRYKQYHAYTENDRPGGDFIDNWIMIGEDGPDKMRFGGRNEGWLWPYEKRGGIGVVYTKEQRWAEVYATPAEALEAFKADAARYIKSKEAELAYAHKAVERVTGLFEPYARFPIGTEVRLKGSVENVPPGSWQATAKVIAYVFEKYGGLTLDGPLGGLQHWNVEDVEPVT